MSKSEGIWNVQMNDVKDTHNLNCCVAAQLQCSGVDDSRATGH